jgi:hypothetical protein
MATVTFIQGKVQWSITEQPSGRFVGVCEPLGIALEGTDMNDLHACIREAIQLVMSDLLRNGQLESFLLARGWRTASALPDPRHEPVHFEPPIELLIQQAAAAHDSQRMPN